MVFSAFNLLAADSAEKFSFANPFVWAFLLMVTVLLFSLLLAAILKRFVPFLHKSLIPNSVLGGIILLVISTILYFTAGKYLFDLSVFNPSGNTLYGGMGALEIITYHCLGVGFVATSMRSGKKKFNKERAGEVFNTGVTTVSTYLVQAIIGMVVTLIATAVGVAGMNNGAGIILCFGFGQGTGQALNYGGVFEGGDPALTDGRNFGLTIAAMGFLVACIVGVVYLAVLKKKGIIKIKDAEEVNSLTDYEDENEIPNVSSMDKFTVQIAIVLTVYAVSFVLMWGLSKLVPSLELVLFGFNFLFGVILTIPVKAVINKLEQKKVIKKKIVNNFMMNRIGGFFFDLMIVAGIAAIQPHLLASHWGVILILCGLGGIVTFLYVFYTTKALFKGYCHEQFLAMFGMLTGTASTGMILLREIDGSYRSPASENLVYQNLPAIVFGLPMMFLAPLAAKGLTNCLIVFGIVIAYFALLNVILFRNKLFGKFFKKAPATGSPDGVAASDADQPTDPAE